MKLTSTSTVNLVLPLKMEGNVSVPQLHDLKVFPKHHHASKHIEMLKEEGVETQLKSVEYNVTYNVLYALSLLGSTNYIVYPQKANTNAQIKIFNDEHDAKKYKFSIKDDEPVIISRFF